MEIRYITSTDSLLDISSVYENSWRYAYKNIIPQDYLDSIPSGRWAGSISRSGMRNLVMTENDRIVGTAGFCSSRWEKYSDCGEVVSIYLLPEYMGKGYGKQLFRACVDELRKSGYNRIVLWVLEENQRARKFYEKNGFVCTDEYLEDNIGGKALREIMYICDCDTGIKST